MYKCKYCGKEFDKPYQIAAHTTMCKLNPNSKPNKIEHNFIDIKQICPKCGKEFELHILENQYLKSKYRKFCSVSCANSHKHSEETKQKISKSIKDNYKLSRNIKNTNNIRTSKNKLFKIFNNICKCCGKEFVTISNNMKYCSQECANKGLKLICKQCNNIFYNKGFRNFCSAECRRISIHDKLSEAGKKSAQIQSNIRRSKNEKLFCQLCEEYFDKVTHNDPIFNGWDADVLIWDYKIAVLWNGKWHYEKIAKQHSVEQVQNRDKIKCKEIQTKGWKVYIIKDLNKFNKQFVREQFDIFIKSLE